MFPRFKQPRCREDYTTLIDDMRARRREASAIKWKFPHVLPVLNDCKDPVPWEGSTDISQPPQVPRRHQPKQRQRVFPEVSSPRDMQVLLLTPLQTGYTKWSQVYVALLTIGGRSCEVVIKLYQQCMFLEPNSANVDEWSSATEVAQREAWAYQMLERYQGSTIPYSYGFYMFQLPTETVVGFVMEKIGGLEVDEYFVRNNNDHAAMLLADTLAWAIDQIHSAGVVHGDLQRSNVRICTDGDIPGSLYFIIFDFSVALQKYTTLNKPTYGSDAYDIMNVTMPDSGDLQLRWRRNNREKRPAWVRMFLVGPNRDFLTL
jgi:hypothetical protein